MNPKQLKEMNEIQWWHQINLGNTRNKEILTPGRDNSEVKLQAIMMPKDLTGKTVIDVGAWDGFFSFEAEKRGAEVLAIDTVMWKEHKTFDVHKNMEVIHTGKRGFDFAHKMLNSKVTSEEIEVMDLSEKNVGKHDLVLCLGILYHMENPFGMCKVMKDLTAKGGQLILETHIDFQNISKPVMAFYPTNECNNDVGTWFGPNPACVAVMLKAAGFDEVKLVALENNRGVFHAW